MWKIRRLMLLIFLLVVTKSSEVRSMTTNTPESTTLDSVKAQNSESSCDKNSTENNVLCNKSQIDSRETQLDTETESLLNQTNTRFNEFFNGELPQPLLEITEPDESEKEFLCRSMNKVIYPKMGVLKDETNAFIVNNELKKQPVNVEICIGENMPCQLFDALPFGYKTSCTQIYSYYPLVALLENGTFVREYFKMPSACKCALTRE